MELLLIRHAIAEDRAVFALTGEIDEYRPLTDKGRHRMQKQLKGLQTQVTDIHSLISSPLTRAQQTAEIVATAYPSACRTVLPALAPGGKVTEVLDYLRTLPTEQVVALVGHEPDLGELATWLLSGQRDTWLPMKKGAACLLSFEGEIAVAEADLRWILTPAQLRGLH